MSDDVTKPDQGQLAVLWTAAYPVVSAYIRAVVRDFHDGEDVLQDVARTTTERFEEYDPSRPFVPWTLGIAKFKLLQYRDKQSGRRLIADSEVLERLSQACDDSQTQMSEIRQALVNCIRALTPRAKRLLELRYVRDLKPQKIADQVGATSNAVSVALHRVREALRQCVERSMVGVRDR